MICRSIVRPLALALGLLGAVSTASADSIVEFELFGAPGNQASNAATLEAVGASGIDLTRGPGLTASAGGNSMNASNWAGPNADDFYTFGFDLDAGSTAVVTTLLFATRSSNTGPGFVDVLYSVDGGAEVLVGTVAQVGTFFSNSLFNLGAIAVTSSFEVFLRSANNTSANGGTVANAGTLRIGDYSGDGGATFRPITIEGTITTAVIPEPSSILLCGVGVGLVVLAGRRSALTA